MRFLFALLVPEVVVESVPRGQLAPFVDEHGRGRSAVLSQLTVCLVGTDKGQLDGVQRVRSEDLVVEAGVDHGCLGTVGAHEMDRLGRVLLAPLGVLVHDLACMMGKTGIGYY
jgi:hypothetical protein